MKRLVGLLLAMIMSLSLCACSQQSEQIKQVAPDTNQIKNICKLATLETSTCSVVCLLPQVQFNRFFE